MGEFYSGESTTPMQYDRSLISQENCISTQRTRTATTHVCTVPFVGGWSEGLSVFEEYVIIKTSLRYIERHP